MKLGITQYTASRDGKNFLAAAARLGVEGVEPCITSSESEFLTWPAPKIDELKESARQQHLTLPSVAFTHFNGDSSIVTGSGRSHASQQIANAMQFAHNTGAKVLMICTFFEGHPDTPAKRDAFLQVVRAVEPIAEKLDMTLALETPLAADVLIDLVDRAASARVRVYYDFGNALAMGLDPAKEIPLLGNRIIAIHAKDAVPGKLVSLHFGDGTLNLPAAMQAVKSIGFKGWILLETPGGDEMRLRTDFDHLRSLMH